jgi:hypothetical protein
MNDLIRFNWRAFDPISGIKVTIGFIVIMALTKLTGETWTATGLVVLLAWLTNVPGPLKDRINGMLVFGAGAIIITVISGQMGLALWPNIIAVSVVGVLGTLALARGTRAYMIGYALICWAIYAPFLVDSTSVTNCVVAILLGTGVLIALNVVAAVFEGDSNEMSVTEKSSGGPGMDYIIAYSITLALVLALTTYLGRVLLKTDPTLIVGGAFFIIGFDAKKTWVAGIGRVIGVVAGTVLGLIISKLVGPGLLLYIIVIAAFFFSFAAMEVHPGFFMFFFLLLLAIGWQDLETETLNLTFWEWLSGQTAGVLIAMTAIAVLQWWQNRRVIKGEKC